MGIRYIRVSNIRYTVFLCRKWGIKYYTFLNFSIKYTALKNQYSLLLKMGSTPFNIRDFSQLPGYVAHVKTEWFSQDLVDPLLFVTTATEHLVSKDGMSGTVTSVRAVTSDTVEISERDYYIVLASLHSSEDSVFPHEEPGEPEAEQGEHLSSRVDQSSRPKRRRRVAASTDFLFY